MKCGMERRHYEEEFREIRRKIRAHWSWVENGN
ncbi:hypothetical protein OIU76_017597 [Salix suchowensis]|nr:hypothetical protein OIU76_017597 [Salix suchowensis]